MAAPLLLASLMIGMLFALVIPNPYPRRYRPFLVFSSTARRNPFAGAWFFIGLTSEQFFEALGAAGGDASRAPRHVADATLFQFCGHDYLLTVRNRAGDNPAWDLFKGPPRCAPASAFTVQAQHAVALVDQERFIEEVSAIWRQKFATNQWKVAQATQHHFDRRRIYFNRIIGALVVAALWILLSPYAKIA